MSSVNIVALLFVVAIFPATVLATFPIQDIFPEGDIAQNDRYARGQYSSEVELETSFDSAYSPESVRMSRYANVKGPFRSLVTATAGHRDISCDDDYCKDVAFMGGFKEMKTVTVTATKRGLVYPSSSDGTCYCCMSNLDDEPMCTNPSAIQDGFLASKYAAPEYAAVAGSMLLDADVVF